MSDEPVIQIGGGYSAEQRANGAIAIMHSRRWLHMAGHAERAMVAEIIRLRAVLQSIHDAPDGARETARLALGL